MPSTLKKGIILLVGMIIVVIMTYILYNRLAGSKLTPQQQIAQNLPGVSGSGVQIMDWRVALDKSAQANALSTWCRGKGYSYNATKGTCEFNEEGCLAVTNKTYQKGEKKPNLIWSDGQCISSSALGILDSSICKNKSFRTTYNADLGFNSGKLTCDDNGNCIFEDIDCTDPSNIDTGNCPACIIPSGYCQSKGLNYESVNGLGDCDESDVQAVFEAIFGKTLTRTFKRNWQNMQKECSHKLLSWNCAKGIGTFETTSGQIVLKTYQKYVDDLVNGFKKNCSGDFTKTSQGFVNCAWSMMKFAPEWYVAEMGMKMVDGMLNGLFGWTGMPKNVLSRGVGYAVKYGIKAAAAVFHFGEKAVAAMDKAGHDAVAFLDKMGFPLNIAGEALGVAMQGIDMMTKYGAEAAKALAHVGEHAVHLMIKAGVVAMKCVNAAIGAVLHPVHFAKQLIAGLENVAENPKAAFDSAVVLALKEMKKLGLLGKQALHLFTQGLKIAGKILGEVWDAVNKELDKIGEDLKDDADHAYNALKSVF